MTLRLDALRFWIVINAYALFLDVLALVIAVLALSAWRTERVLSVVMFAVGAVSAYGGISVHGTYPEKRRMYKVLLRRNMRKYERESFREFMSVPCHRLVVRVVLRTIGRRDEYPIVCRLYYRFPWQRRLPTETTVWIFKTREDGERWPSQQKNRIDRMG